MNDSRVAVMVHRARKAIRSCSTLEQLFVAEKYGKLAIKSLSGMKHKLLADILSYEFTNKKVQLTQ